MSKQVLWNAIRLQEFIRLAALTEDEEQVICAIVKGWSRVKISNELHMSVSKVDRTTATLKLKYDSVQPYSSTLPPRRG